MENKGLNIKVLSTTHVKPRKQLGRKECELTIYDLFHLTTHYNKKLFVYKGLSLEFDDVVDKLKDSLAVVLDDFYYLAGKLWRDEDGYYKVVFDGDMQGVEVVVATAEKIGTDDLTDGKGLKELVPCCGFIGLDGLHQPLLAVQVTELKDGVVIGCALNHAIVDGISTWHFLSCWAQICNGSKAISVQPFLDRVKVQNRRIKLNLTLPTETPGVSKVTEPTDGRIIKSRTFKFSESAIDRIKSKVNANHAEGSPNPYSTFLCFAVHVWRSVTRARQLDTGVKTFLALLADCRKRVNPPVPENYFGNITQTISTVVEAGLLMGSPPEFAAEMIQKAIEMHDSTAIDMYNMNWESSLNTSGRKKFVNGVVFGGSPRFKAYEVDFGWGRPESVRSGGDYKFDGVVLLYQGKSGGKSIDMEISLEANAMKNLEKDMEFLMDDSNPLMSLTLYNHLPPRSFWQFQGPPCTKIISPISSKYMGIWMDRNCSLQRAARNRYYEPSKWKSMLCMTLRRIRSYK